MFNVCVPKQWYISTIKCTCPAIRDCKDITLDSLDQKLHRVWLSPAEVCPHDHSLHNFLPSNPGTLLFLVFLSLFCWTASLLLLFSLNFELVASVTSPASCQTEGLVPSPAIPVASVPTRTPRHTLLHNSFCCLLPASLDCYHCYSDLGGHWLMVLQHLLCLQNF